MLTLHLQNWIKSSPIQKLLQPSKNPNTIDPVKDLNTVDTAKYSSPIEQVATFGFDEHDGFKVISKGRLDLAIATSI